MFGSGEGGGGEKKRGGLGYSQRPGQLIENQGRSAHVPQHLEGDIRLYRRLRDPSIRLGGGQKGIGLRVCSTS